MSQYSYGIFYLAILIICVYHSCAEYQIRSIPSFLNYTFANLTNEIFPLNIEIVFSLTTIAGTLLYSIDNQDNQLIISLKDGIKPSFDFEFGTVHYYENISELCGLESVRFNKLRLRIQLRDKLFVQCNNVLMLSHSYVRTRKFNKAYPIPTFPKSDKLQAYLWLVNTPRMGDIYPNGEQLSGCIFDVFYENKRLIMGTHGVKDKCSTTCTKDICHGGECLETYIAEPFCNCTNSFQNGHYCNDTLSAICYNSTNRKLSLRAIKILFYSTQKEIFEISQNFDISTKLAVREKSLMFIISSQKENSTIERSLIKDFQNGDMYIVIIMFNDMNIHLMYRSDRSSWSTITVPYHLDLGSVVFENLIITGEKIDVKYKSNLKDIDYTKDIFQPKTICPNNGSFLFLKPSNAIKRYWWIIVLVIFVIIGIAIMIFIILRFGLKNGRCASLRKKDGEIQVQNPLLRPNQEDSHPLTAFSNTEEKKEPVVHINTEEKDVAGTVNANQEDSHQSTSSNQCTEIVSINSTSSVQQNQVKNHSVNTCHRIDQIFLDNTHGNVIHVVQLKSHQTSASEVGLRLEDFQHKADVNSLHIYLGQIFLKGIEQNANLDSLTRYIDPADRTRKCFNGNTLKLKQIFFQGNDVHAFLRMLLGDPVHYHEIRMNGNKIHIDQMYFDDKDQSNDYLNKLIQDDGHAFLKALFGNREDSTDISLSGNTIEVNELYFNDIRQQALENPVITNPQNVDVDAFDENKTKAVKFNGNQLTIKKLFINGTLVKYSRPT